MEETRFGIRMPCDDDGFILLRCPHCGELFKLTAEDIESDETLDIYCPSCGLCANNFLTQNVIGLALAKTSNYAMYVIAQQLQAFAKKNSNSLVRFEFKANREREPEPPIRAAIEALQILTCHDYGREAKVSPAIAMSAYTCLTVTPFWTCMLEAQSFRMHSSIKARHAMPPCRFEKTRSHNDATLACANRSFRRRRRAAAKSYSVGCVHGIALALPRKLPPYMI